MNPQQVDLDTERLNREVRRLNDENTVLLARMRRDVISSQSHLKLLPDVTVLVTAG